MKNKKLWDWAAWNQRVKTKIKIHENNNVNKTVLLLLCISDTQKRWGARNLYDLIDK